MFQKILALSASGSWCVLSPFVCLPSMFAACMSSFRPSTFILCLLWQLPTDPGMYLPQVSPVIQALVFSKVVSLARPDCLPLP